MPVKVEAGSGSSKAIFLCSGLFAVAGAIAIGAGAIAEAVGYAYRSMNIGAGAQMAGAFLIFMAIVLTLAGMMNSFLKPSKRF